MFRKTKLNTQIYKIIKSAFSVDNGLRISCSDSYEFRQIKKITVALLKKVSKTPTKLSVNLLLSNYELIGHKFNYSEIEINESMIVDKNSCIESIEIQHEFINRISMNDSITCYIVCAKFLVPCESAKLRVSLIFC